MNHHQFIIIPPNINIFNWKSTACWFPIFSISILNYKQLHSYQKQNSQKMRISKSNVTTNVFLNKWQTNQRTEFKCCILTVCTNLIRQNWSNRSENNVPSKESHRCNVSDEIDHSDRNHSNLQFTMDSRMGRWPIHVTCNM